MNLPEGFQFSQGSLQDYVDCRRRFYLRYLLGLAWPALESEPAIENERFVRQGARFHRMAQQYLTGVPPERLRALAGEEQLLGWLDNFLQLGPLHWPSVPEARIYPEFSLSAALGGYRLVAKLDALHVTPVAMTIYDWKTSRKLPRRAWLAERLQTRVYPYLLVRAGVQFNGWVSLQPEIVTMVYWFAEAPDQPQRFAYSRAQFEQDETMMLGLLEEIQRLAQAAPGSALRSTGSVKSDVDLERAAAGFDLTARSERCAFCVYRSLCGRGVQAGAEDEGNTEQEGEAGEVFLDFEQVAEIEF
ncbi:MAG: PD-(D/E)XK nuclease family protein [Chloroflexota bacterium]